MLIAAHKRSHLREELISSAIALLRAIVVIGKGRPMFKNWMQITRDAMLLGVETQRVMGLRWIKLSRGGRAAETEAMRMATEKSSAFLEAGMTLARGGSASVVIRRYRTHVRANKRRLLKS
jgi:hypothetical protein